MSNYGDQPDGAPSVPHYQRSDRRFVTAEALLCMRRQAAEQSLGAVASFLSNLAQEGWRQDEPNHCFTDASIGQPEQIQT